MDQIVSLAAQSANPIVGFHSLDRIRKIFGVTDDESRPTLAEHHTSNVTLQRLVPHLASWPTRLDGWLDVLPTPSPEERFVAHAPRRGVSWSESRRQGWPPRRFVGRARARVASHELIRGLRWTLKEVLRTGELAMNGNVQFDAKVRDQLTAARAVLQLPLLEMSDAEAPSPQTRRAMRDEGGLWVGVAEVAEALRK